jgi:transposase
MNNGHSSDDFHSNRDQDSDNDALLEQVDRLTEEKFRLMHETEIKKKKEELEDKYDQINRQKIMDIESDFNKRKTVLDRDFNAARNILLQYLCL